MHPVRPLLHCLPLVVLLIAAPTLAAPAAGGTSVDLSAEASRPAANDLARATVFAEASGAAPGELAKRVNGLVADALLMIGCSNANPGQAGGQQHRLRFAKM